MIESSLIAGMQSTVSGNGSQIGSATGAGSAAGSSGLASEDGFWQRFEDSTAALGLGRAAGSGPSVAKEVLSGGEVATQAIKPGSLSLSVGLRGGVGLKGGKAPGVTVASASGLLPVTDGSPATGVVKTTSVNGGATVPGVVKSQTPDGGELTSLASLTSDERLVAGGKSTVERPALTGSPRGAELLAKASQATTQQTTSRQGVDGAALLSESRIGNHIKKPATLVASEGSTAELALPRAFATEGTIAKAAVPGEGLASDEGTASLIGPFGNAPREAKDEAALISSVAVTNAGSSGRVFLQLAGKKAVASADQMWGVHDAQSAPAVKLQATSSKEPAEQQPGAATAARPGSLEVVSDVSLVKAVKVSNQTVEFTSPRAAGQDADAAAVGIALTPASASMGAGSAERASNRPISLTESGPNLATGGERDTNVLSEGGTAIFSKAMHATEVLPAGGADDSGNRFATAVKQGSAASASSMKEGTASAFGVAGLESASRSVSHVRDLESLAQQEIRGVAAGRFVSPVMPSGDKAGGALGDASATPVINDSAVLNGHAVNGPTANGLVTVAGTSPGQTVSVHPLPLSAEASARPSTETVGGSIAAVASMGSAPVHDETMAAGVKTIAAGKDKTVEASDKSSNGVAGVQSTGVRLGTEVPVAPGVLSTSIVHGPSASDSRSSGFTAVEQSGRALQETDQAGARVGMGGLNHTTLVATPNVLEVGVASGTNGWLKVRAELDETGGVSASVVATTASAVEALHKELPALSAYLKDEAVGVSSLVVGRSEAGAMAQNAAAGSGLGSLSAGGSGAGADARGRQEGAESQTVDGFVSESSEQRLRSVPFDGNGTISSTTGYGSGSGGWLNVVA